MEDNRIYEYQEDYDYPELEDYKSPEEIEKAIGGCLNIVIGAATLLFLIFIIIAFLK